VEALKFVGFVLVENLVIGAFLVGVAWLIVRDIRPRPKPPKGPCVNGTNCRAFLPHNSPDTPPMCATCPFVNR
jgi:hypothetical protein